MVWVKEWATSMVTAGWPARFLQGSDQCIQINCYQLLILQLMLGHPVNPHNFALERCPDGSSYCGW